MSEAGVVMRATGWIDQHATSFSAARGAAIRNVKDAIEAAGVEIPDTTYRVRLDGLGHMPVSGVVEVDTDDEPAPAPPEPKTPLPQSAPEDVAPADIEALERMVDAEREDDHNPDLLKQSATLE